MAIKSMPSSGAISFSQMRDTFGGLNPVDIAQYYRGGAGLVPDTLRNTTVPTRIGLPAYFANFNEWHNASTILYQGTMVAATASSSMGHQTGFNSAVMGSLSPAYLANGAGTHFAINEILNSVATLPGFTSTFNVSITGGSGVNFFHNLYIYNSTMTTLYATYATSTATYFTGTIWSWLTIPYVFVAGTTYTLIMD